MRRGRRDEPVLITDAEPSLAAEQRARKWVYAVLMGVHLAGLVAAGMLAHIWWLAVALVVLTVPLPWVAVVLANSHRVGNDLARRWQRPARGGGRSAVRGRDSDRAW